MKLLDYIEQNKNKFTLDNIFCYINDKKKPVIQFALYRPLEQLNEIYLYNNILSIIHLTLDIKEDIPPYYRTLEVDPENFVTIPRKNWSNYFKKSIKNSVDKSSETYQRLLKEVREKGGQLVEHIHKKGKNGMLVGVSSTDEDYYYVIVSEKDNSINIVFDTCCSSLNLIEKNKYTEKDYELINFIKRNKRNIIEKINSLENDVMITPIVIDKDRTHYRIHKDNALEVVFSHCNSFFDRPSKCIEDLKHILLQLNEPKINSYIVSLLNAYIREYSLYYKPLNNQLKNYYREIFSKKLKSILDYYTNNIDNEKVISYLTNICKTLNKMFFNN